MSRQYFDFSGLIRKYENSFSVLVDEKGTYNAAGDWVPGEKKQTVFKGAIFGFTESKVFRSEGKITAKDKRLFTREALPDALMGAEVLYKNQKYMIESESENAEFTGVYSYFLRWVSAFDTV